MRIAIGMEYDGAGFCGWQTQPSRCAIQDVVEAALSEIAGEAVSVTTAGRTDTGVHALGQVLHFDTQAHRPESAWVRGVNALLPATVAVRWSRAVGPDFHARFSARARHYRYVLLNRPTRPGLMSGRVGWYHSPLDVARMRDAAGLLLGEHDFSAFRSSECQAKSPVRRLDRLDIERRGDWIVFDLRANAFLHHMVRNLIGSLVYVGKDKHDPGWLAEVLKARDRTRAAPTFAAEGLYLSAVEYEAHWGLPVPTPETLQDLLRDDLPS